jgi:hypothetical protein
MADKFLIDNETVEASPLAVQKNLEEINDALDIAQGIHERRDLRQHDRGL